MRSRAPVLYHHVVGRFQAAAMGGDAADAPRHSYSHALLRKLETSAADARLDAALAAEQRAEHDTDSDDDDSAREPDEAPEGEAEQADAERAARLAEFERLMRERVLLGKEGGVDYAKVDADASLDRRWEREARLDAEERYFAEED